MNPSNDLPLALRALALHWLCETEPAAKAEGVRSLHAAWEAASVPLDSAAALGAERPVPGRPARPELVSPLTVKHRALLHIAVFADRDQFVVAANRDFEPDARVSFDACLADNVRGIGNIGGRIDLWGMLAQLVDGHGFP